MLADQRVGNLLPKLVRVDHWPMAKSPGKMGRAESSPTFIAGALLDFAGVLSVSFHTALGLFPCFSFLFY